MLTSREYEANAIASAKQAQTAMEEVVKEMTHYEALGLGMAGFCQALWETMHTVDADGVLRWDRGEILDLLHTALGGAK